MYEILERQDQRNDKKTNLMTAVVEKRLIR